jgi:hypothetical protein
MDSLIDDSSLDRCQRCKGDLPGEPNQPSAWPSALCPKCLKAVRMTWMQDDLDERGNLWREFVGLVSDWFAEADFQPLSERHRDSLKSMREAVLQFGAQKLHADDSHTSENFLAAVVTKDMSRCQRLWQPLVKQIAANHKMISDGIKPPGVAPVDNGTGKQMLPYKWPDKLVEDQWIYENIHSFSFDGLRVEYVMWCQSKGKNKKPLSRNGYKDRAERYREYHHFSKRRFKGVCECPDCQPVSDT